MKKMIISAISATTLFVTINPLQVHAAVKEAGSEDKHEVLSMPKQNLEITKGNIGDTYLEYEYDSNGESFRVIENANDDFTEVDSITFIKNSAGEFEEYATHELNIDGMNADYTVDLGEESLTSSQDLSISMQDGIMLQDEDVSQSKGLSSVRRNSVNGTCNGYDTGGWRFLNNTTGSTAIQAYTVTAVVGAMSAVAISLAPTTSIPIIALGGGATAVAALVVSQSVPIVYYSMSTYDLRIQNPPLELNNFTVGINVYARWYTHSSLQSNFHLGNTDDYFYDACHSS